MQQADVIQQILNDLPAAACRFELIRSKQGVHVFRCEYEGRPAVVKYLEHEGDRREIANYRLLQAIGVPTMKVYALCESCIVMEDISISADWRLGEEDDLKNPSVLRSLAGWYFALHESGENISALDRLYSENDELTPSAVRTLRETLPGSEELCGFAEANIQSIHALLRARENTLTYNDFYYTNLLVRKDCAAAMMFDYNYLGRGYRYADFRNVESSVSADSFAAFAAQYSALHRAKYGTDFSPSETDRRLDAFLSPFLGLVNALGREKFPVWAESFREDALSGALLLKGKELLTNA